MSCNMCLDFRIFINFFLIITVFICSVPNISSVKIDLINCGVDNEETVQKGDVGISTYPFVGILFFPYDGDQDTIRSVTTVVLIHPEFVLGVAADIGEMPRREFRENARVLIGEDWREPGRRVRSYTLHPEYKETYNTLAVVNLKDPVKVEGFRPICPPPDLLRNPELYVIKFHENFDYEALQKSVIPVEYVPGKMCKEFYVSANLYAKKMRPPHVVCAVSLESEGVCVWEAGGALVTRDVWGRWQLLGIGVRGPGCSAPARYLDMLSYYPWIHLTLHRFNRISISKINKQSYVLRSSYKAFQEFGACEPHEKTNLVYRESIVLRTDNNQYQFMTYNLSIREDLEMSCCTLDLVNASAVSEMSIQHFCPRTSFGPACHAYKGSLFHISVFMMFSDKCSFEMFIWGWAKNMTLIDKLDWKWEEGTYYEDFRPNKVEYRGQTFQTLFGFEPLDQKMWVPEYDLWTTTEFDNSSWSSTTPLPDKEGVILKEEEENVRMLTSSTTAIPKQTFATRKGGTRLPGFIVTSTTTESVTLNPVLDFLSNFFSFKWDQIG